MPTNTQKEEKQISEKVKKEEKAYYFFNRRYSALKILVRGGKDELGAEGVKETARFTPYYDMWKGDVVRVGYLKTFSKNVAERCFEDSSCEEITEKEYTEAVEGAKALRKAPLS